MINRTLHIPSSSRTQTSSHSQLLTNPQTTLQDLLDDDNFISEFRCGSAKIRQFMAYKRMKQMVQLVTQPGDPADQKRSYKFPLTAADLLSVQTPFVIDMLLPEEEVQVEQQKMVSPLEHTIQQESKLQNSDLDLSSSESSHEDKLEQVKNLQKECEKAEEEFGEFVSPSIQQKQIVNMNEQVKKGQPGLVIQLLEYFNSPINYTLTAYCCKILTSLLNKRTSKFLARLFQNEHHAIAILNHIESRSTVQLLTRVFTIQTSDYLQERLRLFRKMVESSSLPQELNVISNISATICETIEKINVYSKSTSPFNDLRLYLNSIPQMLPIVVSSMASSHQAVSMYSVGILFAFLNSLPAELDNDAIDITLFRFIDTALNKLREAVEEKRSYLGVGRVRILQLLNFVLKRSLIQEYLAKKQIFPIIFSIIRAYPLNNILHSEAFRFIMAVLTTKHLAINLLKGTDFIDWLSLQAQEEKETANKNERKGYGGHLLNLCKKLKQLSGSNAQVLEFINYPRFSNVWKVLVDRPTIFNQFDLGGYSSHRVTKLHVSNSREEILKHYSAFLANEPPPVYQSEGEYLHPILLEQLQRQLDGVQIENANKDRPQQVVEQQKHKAELIEENGEYMFAFWKIHLSYNAEDLIEDLI